MLGIAVDDGLVVVPTVISGTVVASVTGIAVVASSTGTSVERTSRPLGCVVASEGGADVVTKMFVCVSGLIVSSEEIGGRVTAATAGASVVLPNAIGNTLGWMLGLVVDDGTVVVPIVIRGTAVVSVSGIAVVATSSGATVE